MSDTRGALDESAATVAELVAANRILGHEGILDAYGHVSVRHPRDPQRFLLARARSPENVEAADVLVFDLAGDVVGPSVAVPYIERYIHAALYAARPDVGAVCHNHALSILPFGISRRVRLHATTHASRLLGDGVPVWDIADEFGEDTDLLVRTIEQGRSLAAALGPGPVVLMRGHGSVVAAPDLRLVVRSCLEVDRGARALTGLVVLGLELPPDDVERSPLPTGSAALDEDEGGAEWDYLCRRAGVGS